MGVWSEIKAEIVLILFFLSLIISLMMFDIEVRIIVEVDVPGSEPLLEMADMRHHVVGGVVPETASENRPVAVGAGVGTAAAGDATRIGDARVVENRQGIGGGISVELFIGREGEFVQNELMIPVPVEDRGAVGLAPDQPLDRARLFPAACGKVAKRFLALADYSEIQGGIPGERFGLER